MTIWAGMSEPVMPGNAKARMKSRTTKAEAGSILMETVIAIPLFMLLIGGIMWIGQLMYDKQKLVIADRYVAWNYGNRYGGDASQQAVQSRFFDQSTPDKVSGLALQKVPPNEWWYIVHGAVNLDVTMPSWTYGWLTADAIMKGQSLSVSMNVPSFHGRDLPDTQVAGGHSVVMRSGYDDTRTNVVEPGGVDGNPQPQMGVNLQKILDWSSWDVFK